MRCRRSPLAVVATQTAKNCHEVRGKSIGIVGYGHVGSQVSVLAEALGMKVYFYDIRPKMALGSSIALETLNELLTTVDFVTLHVPETPQTKVRCALRERIGSLARLDR